MGERILGEKEYQKKFYLVREDVLPEAMKKTLEAKELIERKKSVSIWDAVQQVDLSRSAFYKYRDTVLPFHRVVKEKIISLFFYLEDRPGSLSTLLAIVAKHACNVLTIHQTIPLQGRANVTLSLDIANMNDEIDDLLAELNRLEFVDRVDVLSSGG
ncbi:ACT domain-containing protein [Bacillus sp. J14TS2]|uniref:ACT domain-containing protein n=1 Tax=Bacillus sp. J14TS2 TaxID=2807188 RepID=UPI001BB398F1